MAKYRFGDLVKEVKEKVDRDNNPYDYYIAGDHMDTDELHLLRRGAFAGSDVGPAFIRIFKPGHVLYGSRRTYLRKVAVADFEGVTANTTFVLESKDESILLQRLLPFIMQSDRFMEHSIKRSKGSTNPYVLFSDLFDYEVEIPGIEKQRELADLLWAIDAVKTSYKKLISATDELVKSQFIEMFGDPETNPYGLPVKRFDEVATIDANMTTDYEKYADYPHIGIDSIEKDTGKLFGYRTVREDNVISGKYVFGPQHIIYSKIRPALNKVALPDFEGLCSADAYPILPKEGVCTREFLAHVMRSDYYLRYILTFSGRSQMPKVNRKQISGFSFPVPPLEEQKSFILIIKQSDKSKFSLQTTISAHRRCEHRLPKTDD